MFSSVSRFLLIVPLLPLASCGVGGIGEPATVFVALPSIAAFDGYTTSGGAVLPNSGTNAIAVGDNSVNDSRRGFVRFDLTSIPPGATILSAVMRLYQGGIDGAPYGLGTLRVDHVDIGGALDAGDHFAGALALDIGTISTDAVQEFKSLDVTARVALDVAAASPKSDFRLRFPVGTDADGVIDSALFEDAENNLGTGLVPTLFVTYQEP